MNKMQDTSVTSNQVSLAALILRLGAGFLMLTHGIPKLEMLLNPAEVQFPGVLGLSPALSLGLAVFAEVFCSILIIVGLGTRFATIPLIITMLIAVFLIHGGDPFARQEMGLLYLFLYVPLLILGSGKSSLDQVLKRLRHPIAA